MFDNRVLCPSPQTESHALINVRQTQVLNGELIETRFVCGSVDGSMKSMVNLKYQSRA